MAKNKKQDERQYKSSILNLKKDDILKINELGEDFNDLFREAGIIYDEISDYITALEMALDQSPVGKKISKEIKKATLVIDAWRVIEKTNENFNRIVEEELGPLLEKDSEVENMLKSFYNELDQIKNHFLNPSIIIDPNKETEYIKEHLENAASQIDEIIEYAKNSEDISWEKVKDFLEARVYLAAKLFDQGIAWREIAELVKNASVVGKVESVVHLTQTADEYIRKLFKQDNILILTEKIEEEKTGREEFLKNLDEQKKAWWKTMFEFEDELNQIEMDYLKDMKFNEDLYYEERQLNFIDAFTNKSSRETVNLDKKIRDWWTEDSRKERTREVNKKQTDFEEANPYPISEEELKLFQYIYQNYKKEKNETEFKPINPAPAVSTYVQKPATLNFPNISQIEQGNFGITQSSNNSSDSNASSQPVVQAEKEKLEAIQTTVQFVTASSEAIGKEVEIQNISFKNNAQVVAESTKANADSLNDLANVNAEVGKKIAQATEESTQGQDKSYSELADEIKKKYEKIMGYASHVINAANAVFQSQIEDAQEKIDEISAKYDEVVEKKKESDEEIKSLEDRAREAKGGALQVLQQQINQEIAANKQLADQEKTLAKEKEKAEKEKAKKEKQQRKSDLAQKILHAVANTSFAVTAVLPNLILASIIGASGAVQVGIMTQQLAKLEDGGLLQGKHHSQGGMRIEGTNIEVEGGEYVVNRRSTQKNFGLIDYINSQRKKVSLDELSAYFHSGSPHSATIPIQTMFADGGQLPVTASNINISNADLIEAIREIQIRPVVSVEDITYAQENAVEVNSWIGM